MIDLIIKYEGFSNKSYICPAGKWTIGYGSTTWEDGRPVKKDEQITKDKAEALLLDYVIKNCIPVIEPLGLKENQKKALCSLIYNIGIDAFKKSKVYEALKLKDWQSVYRNWDWIVATDRTGKRIFLSGLAKRRAEELYLLFKDL